jgi:hypothetical protein
MFAFIDEYVMQVKKSGRSTFEGRRKKIFLHSRVLKPKSSKLSQCNVHGIISGKEIAIV